MRRGARKVPYRWNWNDMLYTLKDNITETWLDYPLDGMSAVICFLEGCNHKCKGCQSPHTWNADPSHGHESEEVKVWIEDYAKRCGTTRVVLSGGDPFCSDMLEVLSLIHNLTKDGYDVCVYTGYDIDFIEWMYGADLNYGMSLMRPRFVCTGCYREDMREETWGKTRDGFRLVSRNQRVFEFRKRKYGLDGKFVQVSDDNYLDYHTYEGDKGHGQILCNGNVDSLFD